MSTDTYREVIAKHLPKNWGQDRRDTTADEIVSDLEAAGILVNPECTTIEVTGARMPVETIEAYGLEIKLDANGEASSISRARWREQHGEACTAPAGLVVVE